MTKLTEQLQQLEVEALTASPPKIIYAPEILCAPQHTIAHTDISHTLSLTEWSSFDDFAQPNHLTLRKCYRNIKSLYKLAMTPQRTTRLVWRPWARTQALCRRSCTNSSRTTSTCPPRWPSRWRVSPILKTPLIMALAMAVGLAMRGLFEKICL